MNDDETIDPSATLLQEGAEYLDWAVNQSGSDQRVAAMAAISTAYTLMAIAGILEHHLNIISSALVQRNAPQ